ncbi:hypothetical protein [Methylobacterium brachythecii]|uniref:Flagellar protein FlaG n=1 Tax=Methylobacterium brachythecii TaxID=1176177 RepID=A0A7W6AJH8_9HYPH|nr:hypothetical protein [Methylobacterium brachythecii]MBB3904542.1 hypothetical protein [Methylobacterium brachythecii]GLS45794.1 hypothetical protein GCM10007884_37850 [Methylobacterium brachythecii]
MEPIRPVQFSPPVPAIEPISRATGVSDRGDGDRTLDPAVSLDLSPEAANRRRADESRGYVRDKDSESVVFRITDTVSGDVIVQIPNEIVIKARVYGREQNPPVGERIEKHA